jgi:phosphonate transport system substrate-binding protein
VPALVALMALGSCTNSGGRPAEEDWRGQVKELRFALIALTDASGGKISTEPFRIYMERATGLPVRVHQVTDVYTSAIQALASGQVDVAHLAGGGYVNAREQVGALVAPLLVAVGAHGERGYYSSLVVRSDSPYHSIADLRGKALAVVDYNSTSGYLVPMHAMRAKGIDPARFFSKIGVTGGHQQAVIAVYNRQYDAAWTLSSNGTPQWGFAVTTQGRMEARGMIPRGAIRGIWDVGPVPNTSLTMRTDRPQALQDLVRGAIAAIPYDAPEAFTSIGSLPGVTYAAGSDAMFAEIARLRKEAIAGQRASAGKSH